MFAQTIAEKLVETIESIFGVGKVVSLFVLSSFEKVFLLPVVFEKMQVSLIKIIFLDKIEISNFSLTNGFAVLLSSN